MTKLRNLLLASALAAAAALGAAGTATAAPANAGNFALPPATDGEAATPAHHWRHHCRPIYRWVWTHWGWRYRYVGTRCHPRYWR